MDHRARISQLCSWLFELCLLAFFPTLVFGRGLNSALIRVGFLAWIVRRSLSSPKEAWDRRALGIGLAVAASWSVSSAFSEDPGVGFRGLLSLLDAFLLFWVAQDAPAAPSFWRRMGWVVLGTMALVGVDALGQQISGSGWLSQRTPELETGFRITGPFANSNLLTILSAYLPALWLLRLPTAPRLRILALFAAVALLGLAGAALYLSHSRNAWLTAGIFLLFAVWVRWKWTGLAAAFLLLAPALWFTAGGKFVLENTRRELEKPTVRSRLEFWPIALQLWKEQPWIGTGPRQFGRSWPQEEERFRELGATRSIPKPHHPHNILLETLLEQGVFGLAAYLALLGAAWHAARRGLAGSVESSSARFVLAGIALLFLAGLFDFSIHLRVYAYSIFFFCGLAFSAAKSSARRA